MPSAITDQLWPTNQLATSLDISKFCIQNNTGRDLSAIIASLIKTYFPGVRKLTLTSLFLEPTGGGSIGGRAGVVFYIPPTIRSSHLTQRELGNYFSPSRFTLVLAQNEESCELVTIPSQQDDTPLTSASSCVLM